METFHWVYLLSIVRPRGTSHCKVPQKAREQIHGSFAFYLNFDREGSVLAEWWQIKGKYNSAAARDRKNKQRE